MQRAPSYLTPASPLLAVLVFFGGNCWSSLLLWFVVFGWVAVVDCSCFVLVVLVIAFLLCWLVVVVHWLTRRRRA